MVTRSAVRFSAPVLHVVLAATLLCFSSLLLAASAASSTPRASEDRDPPVFISRPGHLPPPLALDGRPPLDDVELSSPPLLSAAAPPARPLPDTEEPRPELQQHLLGVRESLNLYGDDHDFSLSAAALPANLGATEDNPITIVLVGITGEGKSETANTLGNFFSEDPSTASSSSSRPRRGTVGSFFLGQRGGAGRASSSGREAGVLDPAARFKATDSVSSCTKGCQVEKFEFEGRHYQVIDTPGLEDNTDEVDVEKELVRIRTHATNGVHAFFYIVRGDGRFHTQAFEKLKQFTNLFPGAHRHSAVLFTRMGGDGGPVDDLEQAIVEEMGGVPGLAQTLAVVDMRMGSLGGLSAAQRTADRQRILHLPAAAPAAGAGAPSSTSPPGGQHVVSAKLGGQSGEEQEDEDHSTDDVPSSSSAAAPRGKSSSFLSRLADGGQRGIDELRAARAPPGVLLQILANTKGQPYDHTLLVEAREWRVRMSLEIGKLVFEEHQNIMLDLLKRLRTGRLNFDEHRALLLKDGGAAAAPPAPAGTRPAAPTSSSTTSNSRSSSTCPTDPGALGQKIVELNLAHYLKMQKERVDAQQRLERERIGRLRDLEEQGRQQRALEEQVRQLEELEARANAEVERVRREGAELNRQLQDRERDAARQNRVDQERWGRSALRPVYLGMFKLAPGALGAVLYHHWAINVGNPVTTTTRIHDGIRLSGQVLEDHLRDNNDHAQGKDVDVHLHAGQASPRRIEYTTSGNWGDQNPPHVMSNPIPRGRRYSVGGREGEEHVDIVRRSDVAPVFANISDADEPAQRRILRAALNLENNGGAGAGGRDWPAPAARIDPSSRGDGAPLGRPLTVDEMRIKYLDLFGSMWFERPGDQVEYIPVADEGQLWQKRRVGYNNLDGLTLGSWQKPLFLGFTVKSNADLIHWSTRDHLVQHPSYGFFSTNCQHFSVRAAKYMLNGRLPHNMPLPEASFHGGASGPASGSHQNGRGGFASAGSVAGSVSFLNVKAAGPAVSYQKGGYMGVDLSVGKVEAGLGFLARVHVGGSLKTGAGITEDGMAQAHFLGVGAGIGRRGLLIDTPVGGGSVCSVM